MKLFKFLNNLIILQYTGTFIIVSIFKGRFKMPEKYIGIIGGLSQIIAPIAFMFSFNTYAIFGSNKIYNMF